MIYRDEIVDAHMHLWDLANPYPWLNEEISSLTQMIGDYHSLRRNFLIQDYLTLVEKHNVVKTVHLEVSGFPENPVNETRWLQQIADKHHFPNAIIAFAKLDEPNIATILEEHTQFRNIRGIRMPLNWHDTEYFRMTDRPDYMQDEIWLRGFSLLSHYNFSFDLQVYDHQLPEVALLAKRFADTQMIVEHMGWPTAFSENDFYQWQERLRTVADCRNVSIKLSGIGVAFQKKISPERIKDYIVQTITIMGSHRCMFGSDFPPDSLFYHFDELIDLVKSALSHLSYQEQRNIFYENANRIYRI